MLQIAHTTHTHPHSLPLRESLLFQEVEVILQLLVLCLHVTQLLSVPGHRGIPAGLLLLHSTPELLQLDSSGSSNTTTECTLLACLHSRRLQYPHSTVTWLKQPQCRMHDSNMYTVLMLQGPIGVLHPYFMLYVL